MKKIYFIFFLLCCYSNISYSQISKEEVKDFLNEISIKNVKQVRIIFNGRYEDGFSYRNITSITVKHNETSMIFEVNGRRYLIAYKAIKYIRFREEELGSELTIDLFS